MRRTRLTALLLLLFAPAALQPLHAQNNRDSLAAGSAAYDRADFPAAIRQLAIGLDPNAGPRDSAWVAGVHKLADALIQTNDTADLRLWMSWANRVAPAFRVDTLNFTPPVQQAILAGRAAARGSASDSLVTTSWQFGGDASTRRGAVKFGRMAGFQLAVVDSVGSLLPDERRTLPAGTYGLTLNVDGAVPIKVTREVLPGVTTIITPKPRAAIVAATESAGQRAAAEADTSAALDARLSAGGSTSCYAATNATWCWGANGSGQLGAGWTDSTRAPAVVANGRTFTQVSVGGGHACGVTAQGSVWCWGAGLAGQLGNGASTNSATPVAVSGGQAFAQVAAGALHTCAIAKSGAIYCWGQGQLGQLGNRQTAGSNVPVTVGTVAGTTFKAITAGGNHTCALTSRGAALCWGSGSSGELGNGSTNNATQPVNVAGDNTFIAIAAGESHTCGVLQGGKVMCWGSNAAGQLGTGTVIGASRPQALADTTSFMSIAAGDDHTCALTPAPGYAAWCWGSGGSGQLGNGRTSDSNRPTLVVGGLDLRALAAGASHTCGVTSDRQIWCWGANDASQVGALGPRATPAMVISHPPVRPVAAGLRPRTDVRDNFDDGNITAGVVWSKDSSSGARVAVDSGALSVSRTGARGSIGAAGASLRVQLPVRGTALRLDVMVASNLTPGGCGLDCAAWPAMVRVHLKNRDFTESDLWYVWGVSGRRAWSAPGLIVVPHEAPLGQWLRRQRLVIADDAPRADSILEIAVGGIGTEFASKFDNITLPQITIAQVAITPDSARITEPTGTVQLTAVPKDSSGAAQTWAAITWSSSDTTVAKVSASGSATATVTAVGNGTALIRASAEEGSGSAKITVRLAPQRRTPARTPRRRP